MSEGVDRRDFLKLSAAAGAGFLVGAAVGWYAKPAPTVPPPEVKEIRAYLIVSTPIEEPWVGVVHHALLKAEETYENVTYDWAENTPYSDVARVMREAVNAGYNLIFADVFGAEEEARDVAADYPDVYFVLGSGLGPVDPNVAVFDNWIHEPAYICGAIAAKLTDSNVIGTVGGYAIPEVNRLINAFKYGVKDYNPDAQVKITFINSWFDPPTAASAARSQIDAGADVMYAERYDPFSITVDEKIPTFGNLLDQWENGPNVVITGPEWDMWPAVNEVISMIIEDRWQAKDLAEWTMMAKQGAKLAGWTGTGPDTWHNYADRLEPEIVQKIQERGVIDLVAKLIDDILSGRFRVPIDETVPVSD
jgi:basic membrane lipoprotein Med (substrate-binding protein (PBP1-ABC) superfamily)